MIKFMRRFLRRLRPDGTTQAPTPLMQLESYLDRARRARFSERYEDAIQLLDAAADIAKAQHATTAQVDIDLTRGDILIDMERYDEAQPWFEELRDRSRDHQHFAPMAYAMSALGQIAQRRGELDAARNHYEEARSIAGKINAEGAAGRATAHLADVYLSEDNAAYALHLLRDALPKLEQSGDRELLGYFLGRMGQALIITGQHSEGLTELRRGLETAVALQNRPQIRRISAMLGQQATADGEYHLARHHFEDAINLHPPSQQTTPDFAHLLIAMSKALTALQKVTEAHDYAQRALTIAEERDDAALRARAQITLGEALHAANKDEEARAYLQRAQAYYANAPHAEPTPELLSALAATAPTPAEKLGWYQQALDAITDDSILSAQIHRNMAQLLQQQGDHKAAIQQWSHAIQQYEAANRDGHVAQTYCELGAAYASAGDGRMAQRQYEKALTALNANSDTIKRGDVLAAVATAYIDYGDLETAQAFFTESIEIARRAEDHRAEAIRRCAYGRLLALSDRGKQAITELMQARNQSHEQGYLLTEAVATAYLGIAYASLNDYEKAREHQNRALSELRILAARSEQASVEVDLGDTLRALNLLDDAQNSYESALALANEHNNIAAQIRAQFGLAQIALANEDIDQAADYLNTTEPFMRHLMFKRLQADWQQLQSQIHAARGEMDAAQTTWEEAHKLRKIMTMPEIEPVWLNEA